MNSFECDMRRAVLSPGFFFAVGAQLLALWYGGFSSTLYEMTVPLACALPYASGWLEEYGPGFYRLSLVRGRVRGYIWGKYWACALSGGGAEALAAWLYTCLKGEKAGCDFPLLALAAMVWAAVSALLAAVTGSKYVAYGGAFVVCYFLIILCERYGPGLYCLNPREWLAPAHVWAFGRGGTAAVLIGILLSLWLLYDLVLERRLSHA